MAVKREFLVLYKGNARSPEIERGRHGKFDSLADAQGQLEQCRDWFNRKFVEGRDRDTKLPCMTHVHDDKVIAWIEEYEDGVLISSGEPVCAESLGDTASEQRTGSTGSESAEGSSIEPSRRSLLAMAKD